MYTAIQDEDEFLMSLNRFNVMASRARATLLVLVSRTCPAFWLMTAGAYRLRSRNTHSVWGAAVPVGVARRNPRSSSCQRDGVRREVPLEEGLDRPQHREQPVPARRPRPAR